MREHTKTLHTKSYFEHQDASKHDRKADEEEEEHSVSADDMIERICGELPKWAVSLRLVIVKI